jgi:hypothetical protein
MFIAISVSLDVREFDWGIFNTSCQALALLPTGSSCQYASGNNIINPMLKTDRERTALLKWSFHWAYTSNYGYQLVFNHKQCFCCLDTMDMVRTQRLACFLLREVQYIIKIVP